MRDSVREEWLLKHEWQFEYREAVELSAINITESVRRQIRMEAEVDQSHVVRLATALKDGASFPPIMIAEVGDKFELADGIHRCAAHQSVGSKTVDAYVITNAKTPQALELLRRTANAPSVKGFSTEEASRQAVVLVQKHGWKTSDAARVMQISESQVSLRIRAAHVAERISHLMPKLDPKFPLNTLDMLGRIQRDDLLKEAARIIHQRKMSEQVARPLFGIATSVATDRDAETLLTEWGKTYPERKGLEPAITLEPDVRLDRARARFQAALTYFDRLELHGVLRDKSEEILRWIASECLQRAAGGAGTVSGRAQGVDSTRRGSKRRSTRTPTRAVHSS